MKVSQSLLLASAVSLSASFLSAQTFDGGFSNNDIGDSQNWSSSSLPTNSLSPGVINAVDGTVDGSVTYDGLFITQTGANITQDDQGAGGYTFSNGSYTMEGGTWGTRRGLVVGSGQTFTIDGGTFGVASPGGGGDSALQISTGGTFILNSGSVTVSTDNVFVAGGSLIVNGGSFTSSGSFGNASFNPAATEVSFNGGTSFLSQIAFGKASALSFGGSTAGSVTVDGSLSVSGVTEYDWASGSLMQFTITGADSAFYEGLWTAGDLLVDGAQIGNFSDNFSVSGGTLSLVPEPSTYALLSGMLAFGWILVRRREL